MSLSLILLAVGNSTNMLAGMKRGTEMKRKEVMVKATIVTNE